MNPMESLKITKFKLGRKALSCIINFEFATPAGEIATGSVEIHEAPHTDLIDALNKLLYLAIESHGMEAEEWNKLGQVTGITFKEAEPNIYGIVLSVQKPVTCEGVEAPALVNTPYLTSEFLEADQPLIREAVAEIRACFNGKRLNPSLFDTPITEEEETEDED